MYLSYVRHQLILLRVLCLFVVVQIDEHNLPALHEKLKRSRSDTRDLQQQITRTKQDLDRDVGLNARLKEDVRNYLKKVRHLDMVHKLQQKRPWLVSHTLPADASKWN